MTLSRRRFLTIASAACLGAGAARAKPFRWRGIALGARTQIILDHPDAAALAERAQAEMSRLERVFSLYRAESDVMRLNATGHLEAPSFDLLACLAQARRVHEVTGGRFDPTVQPLWQVVARAASDGRALRPQEAREARALIGFDRVRFDAMAVVMEPGQALTLNGIAQGYIADRVADLMRAAGVRDVLIDTGEISALGSGVDPAGWPVTLAGTSRELTLRDRALATSALLGTVLDAAGTQGHILDPRDGALRPRGARQVSVSARSAALADGLSTGLSLVDNLQDAQAMISGIKDARLESFLV